MAFVTYPEKSFLQLVARRVLKYQRDAETRNEVYHDIMPFSPLQCGAFAKYRFLKAPGGYTVVLHLKNTPTFSPEDLTAIASEILDGPVRQSSVTSDVLEYVRETAPTPPSGWPEV